MVDFDKSTTRLPESRCPYCERILNAAKHATEEVAPKPGDATVCLYCAQVLIFDASLTPRRPFYGELEAVYTEYPALKADIRRHQRIIRGLDRRDAEEPTDG